MAITRALNDLLERTTGRRLVAPPPRAAARPGPVTPAPTPRAPRRAEDRLVERPVFLLSSVRSGSTLLRAILDSHSAIHAPIELHARRLAVQLTTPPVRQSMQALDLDQADLEHLLWDRLLHRQLTMSGKQVLVEKTPSNVFVADRLATCWPDARFIHLLRHPVAAAQSWHEGDPTKRPVPEAIKHVAWYTKAVERERQRHPGLTVRYEQLVHDPAAVTRQVCDFLGVAWEPGMLDYGRDRDAEFVKGIGDWSDKIRSGRIQPARIVPAEAPIPPALADISRAWGYAA